MNKTATIVNIIEIAFCAMLQTMFNKKEKKKEIDEIIVHKFLCSCSKYERTYKPSLKFLNFKFFLYFKFLVSLKKDVSNENIPLISQAKINECLMLKIIQVKREIQLLCDYIL